MLHLVEPVWSTRVPALLRAAANTEPPAVFPTTPSAAQCMGELPCCIKWTSGMTHESGSTAFSSVFEWLSLPFVRGTKSTNAGIRRLALASLLHAWAHGVTPCSKVPGSVDGGPGGSMGEASSSGAATSSSAGSSSSTWLQQMVGMEGGVQPLLQLLQRLLPVLDSEILSQEELPGASSQAHAASVQQLRMLMSAAFTSIMQVMLLHGENPKHAKQPVGCAAGSSMPVVDTTEHGKDCTDWDPNALLPIQMVLEHCLGGTQRSCAVVFLVQALGDALERLCTSGTDSRMASLGHALRLQYIPACCQMLRSHLHPLAGRQALLHPRPLHVQLLHGVAWIASILVDPFACSMDDSARFLSVVCSTGAIASAAVAWQLQQLPQQLQVWLVEALVGSSTGGTGQVPTEAPAVQWMQQQLHASTSDTQTAVPIHAVQAVAGAAPLLPLDVQRSLLQAVLDASSSTTTRSQPQALQCRVLQYARLTFLNSFLDSACAVAAAAALGSACKQLEQITHACFIWHEAVYITHLTSSQAASQLGPTAAGVVANAVPSVPVLLWDNACCQAMLKLTSLMSSAACSVWAGQILLQYSSPWRIALVPQLLALAAAPSLDHQVSVMCSACIALAPIASPDLESTVALAILQALTSAPPAAASCNAVMLSMEQACSSMAGFERSTRIVLLERFQLLRQVLIGHLLAAVHAVQCTAPGSSQLPPDLQLELASCCIEELDAAADEAVPLLLHNLLLSVPWDGLKPRRPQDHNQTQEGQALQALEVVQQGVKQGRLDTAGDEVGQEECLQRSLAAARLVSRLLVQLPAVLSGLRRRGGGGAGGVVSGCGGSMGMDAASMLPRVFLHPFIMLAGLGQQATAVKASSASKGNGGSKTASTDSSSSRRVLAQVQAGLHARIEKETIPWLLTQVGVSAVMLSPDHGMHSSSACLLVLQGHAQSTSVRLAGAHVDHSCQPQGMVLLCQLVCNYSSCCHVCREALV